MKKFGNGLFLFLFIALLPLSAIASDVQPVLLGDNTLAETQCTTQEYSFPSIASERFIVSMTECPEAPSCGTNDGFNPCVRLKGPLREKCLSDTFPGSTVDFLFTAPSDGERLLSVYDDGGNKSGWFNLFVQSLTDPQGYVWVELGEDIVGGVAHCGEVDSYVFTGSSGDVASFDFEPTDGSEVCGRYQLFDPTGAQVFAFIEHAQSPVSGVTWELPTDGEYLLLVSSCNLETGEYVMHTGVSRDTTTTTTTTSSTLSSTSTSSSTTTTTLEPECKVCADHNGINGVTATDALMILNTAVGFGENVGMRCDAGCPTPCGDHDGNGRVLATDALKTLRYAVELLTCEEFNAYPH